MQNTERDPRILLGAFFERRTASAKDLARRIECDPRTADGYRRGLYWPAARHWVSIVAAFGKDVTEAVFHPDEAAARLRMELRQREDELEALRAELAEADRAAAGLAQVRARTQDRAAVTTGAHAP